MLTRLKVSGFKNLVDFELRFGPLTCIAGPNGVGKSNIFDAIRFMSLLADLPFVEAARGVRGGDDVVELFTAGGDQRMQIECDVLIPRSGHDDFEQPAEASHTYLTYRLVLRLDQDPTLTVPRIVLEEESLQYITKSDSFQRLGFDHRPDWRESVLGSSSRRVAFITTFTESADRAPQIRLHADRMLDESMPKRGGGRPSSFPIERLPRTVLSSANNADEYRTAVLLRQEMRQWRLLQLEPSALRRPDDFQSPTRIDASGAHVPATLHRLAQSSTDRDRIYAEIGNRLAELVADVRGLRVDRDESRRILRFMLRDRSGVELPASSLSDGTLRFVALAVMERDPTATGVLCLEEPENGIHPERMGAMIRLLQDMAVDPTIPIDHDNPLRQVILSTHSPLVASQVGPADLVFARRRKQGSPDKPRSGLEVVAMQQTWRTRYESRAMPLGDLLRYLGAIGAPEDTSNGHDRVIEVVRDQLRLPLGSNSE